MKGLFQSKHAASPSYTAQMIISADGRLISPLCVVLQEKSGFFGSRVKKNMFAASNLFILCTESGKLTTASWKEFLQKCLFESLDDNSLLILDSWKVGKNEDYIAAAKPENKELQLLVIPEEATSEAQPLDVYFNIYWKKISNYLTNIFY